MLEKLAGKNIIVYDCEIQNVIDNKLITWNDHHLMGLSVAALFDYQTGDYTVFLEKDAADLAARLNRADLVVGFNTTGFDNKLVRRCWTHIDTIAGTGLKSDTDLNNWDILHHSRKAHGGNPFEKGLKLDDHLEGTFGSAFMKTEHGANAPVLWQAGEHGKVISYCLADVRREMTLFEHIVEKGWVQTPMHGRRFIDISEINNLLEKTS